VGKKAEEDYSVIGVLLAIRLVYSLKEKHGKRSQTFIGLRNIFFRELPMRFYHYGADIRSGSWKTSFMLTC
jgi:hypothetical protein